MDIIEYVSMKKTSSGQRTAEAGFTAWNRPGNRARVFAFWSLAAFAVPQAGPELAEEFLRSVRLMCACCYCRQPGSLGGHSFA